MFEQCSKIWKLILFYWRDFTNLQHIYRTGWVAVSAIYEVQCSLGKKGENPKPDANQKQCGHWENYITNNCLLLFIFRYECRLYYHFCVTQLAPVQRQDLGHVCIIISLISVKKVTITSYVIDKIVQFPLVFKQIR